MKIQHLLICLSVFFIACGGASYEYWPLSKFNMDNTALNNNEEIKLLYSSRSKDYNQDKEYYIHLVVVSVSTGDTVNILTLSDNGFGKDAGSKTFNYIDGNSVAGKAMTEVLGDGESSDVKLTKVIRDPNFDIIADNDYPTVIGMVGFFEKN